MKALILALALTGGLAVEARAQPQPGPPAAGPLVLDDVLAGLGAHPALLAADAVVERAQGERLAAGGAFDLRTRARGERIAGYYDRTLLDFELRQPTRLRGLSMYGGWRLGDGEFAPYDLKAATLSRGELRAGLDLPLLAGGAIDRARADERKAGYAIAAGRADRTRRQLELERDAAVAYWDWVVAGQRLAIREAQLELARRRGRDLETTIRQGSTAPIEGIDNARVIATREALEVAARRDFARAAQELSWYLRRGDTLVVATRDRLPTLGALPPPLADEATIEQVIVEARTRQPALAALDARLAANQVDAELAANQQLPALTASAFIQRGLGPGEVLLPDRDRVAAGASLTFELPIQRSTARGAAAIARADRKRLLAEQQLVRERLAIDARFAVTDLATSRQRIAVATEQARIADELAEAERLRFERGDSTILIVNLREEAAADAAADRATAVGDYLKARARYAVTIGRSVR